MLLGGTLAVGFTSLNARWDLALNTPQSPDACEPFCASHEKPWAVKCGWDGRWCSACDECAGGDRVERLSQQNSTAAAATAMIPRPDACLTFCATHEKSWSEKCVWDERECSACDECTSDIRTYNEQLSQQDSRAAPATTTTARTVVAVPPPDACLAFCVSHEKSWSEKCVWDERECSACDECATPVSYADEQHQAPSSSTETHDAAAIIVDEGTSRSVGGVECGSYLIVSMQRSGTTTLCSDILQIGGTWPRTLMGSAFELLNFGGLQRGHKFLAQHNKSDEWGKAHPREIIRTSRREGAQTCGWGFKLFDTHPFDVSQIVDEVDLCVLYRRRNTTAQYLSLKTALATGCWATTPEQQALDPRCQSSDKVTQLGDDWPAFKAKADGWYNASREACRAAGKPTREVHMEDYLEPRWQEDRLHAAL